MLSKNNFIKNQYLLDCDYINKYNLKSIYKKPSINSIVLEFNLKSILKAYDFTQISEGNTEIQTKSFLFLYLLTSFNPFINSNKLKVIKKSDKNEPSYSLKAIYSNKEDLNNFLFSLFIENWHRLIRDDLKLFNSKILKANSYITNEKLVFNTTLPASSFYEMDELINVIPNLNAREFDINLSFILEKKFIVHNHHNFLKNLPMFWISG